nr:DUF1565 domain-containing protein [Fodinibius sp.]NIV11422.1 DUF1565 domain-containing protein [Fodinibius sp.]NIY25032.1 DUF1565 domain-containing protein [Fodinibius sp.]
MNSLVHLSDVTVSENSAERHGGIYIEGGEVVFDPVQRCNIYLNHAHNYYGNDICIWEDSITVVVDTFTVLNPSEHQASPINNFTFDILSAKVFPANADLYVSANGSNSNSGLSPSDPLLGISFAIMKINADSLNPRNIYIEDGIYSYSTTNESFPLHIPNYVSLIGESRNGVIID